MGKCEACFCGLLALENWQALTPSQGCAYDKEDLFLDIEFPNLYIRFSGWPVINLDIAPCCVIHLKDQ